MAENFQGNMKHALLICRISCMRSTAIKLAIDCAGAIDTLSTGNCQRKQICNFICNKFTFYPIRS